MKQAILIWEWKRPKYLRICLDALARVEKIEEWTTFLSIDGPENMAQFEHLFPRVSEVIRWPNHAGNLWHVVRSMEYVLNAGYDRIMFIDGDVILRKDALTQLVDPLPGNMVVSFIKGDSHARRLAGYGSVITREMLLPCLEWVKSKVWVGMGHPFADWIFEPTFNFYDSVFLKYMYTHGLTTREREKSYIGHIGVVGIDFQDHNSMEAHLTSGPPETWLDNAIRLFHAQAHYSFVPPDFRYED